MGDLPQGVVTLLFTDVEGSTLLLNKHPDQYRRAVRRHHDLLLEAVHLSDGAVFETVGDAVYAAFARPTDAVKAALRGQLALQQEEWGETPIRVRMGVHLGEVELQVSDGRGHYFGAPLIPLRAADEHGPRGPGLLSEAARRARARRPPGRRFAARPGRAPAQGPDAARAHLQFPPGPAGRVPAAAQPRARAPQPACRN